MSIEIQNRLNIWKSQDFPVKWYRPDLKVRSFFRKVKWTWQRAKYGWCDRDIWNLDFTLGNYIASSVYKLSKTTHGYPYGITEKEWDKVLKDIANDFYYGTNDDLNPNVYEDRLDFSKKDTEEQKELWKKYSDEELRIYRLMEAKRHRGFVNLEKWFSNLWD